MRVMGIDPGLTRTGYGIVESRSGTLRAIAVGTARAAPGRSTAEQLAGLHAILSGVISEHRPEAVAVERLFFNSNAKTAIRVGQASGVALLAAAEAALPVHEYTPTEVKLAVVGVGNASKDQVAFMVRAILRLEDEPDSPDASDALALAIAHAHGHKMRAAIARAGAGR